MKKHLIFLMACSFLSTGLWAQVDIDKSINLTGPPADAKVSGIKTVSSAGDAVSAEVLQKGTLVYAAATNTGNAYAINLSPAITAYTNGMHIHFRASAANTGPATLSINGLAATAITKATATPLSSGDIANGQLVTVAYDGTNFQLVSRGETVIVDGSVSNEGALTVGAGTGTTSLIQSNTAGSTAVTIQAGSNVSLSESGNTITINSTNPGGTVTSVATGTGLTGGTITATGTISLANIGTAGTYTKVTTNAQGQVTSGTTLSASDIPDLSAGYIRNQLGSAQSANFWISGRGAIGSSLNLSSLQDGALDIGNPGLNYGGGNGWTSNTSGLFMEALDNTEIAVHDAGHRLASLMYFEGAGTNRITIGRNMGWDALATLATPANVGIGTTSPARKLHVAGIARASQGIEVNDGDVTADNNYGISWHGASRDYAIYRESGGWNHPYPDLRIGFHTGIKLGASSGYGGTRFYNNSDMATQIMSVGDGDNYVRLATLAGTGNRLVSADASGALNVGPAEVRTGTTNGSANIGNLRFAWGTSVSSTDDPQVFPLSGFSEVYNVQTTAFNANQKSGLSVSAYSSTSFTINRDNDIDGTPSFFWFVIGAP